MPHESDTPPDTAPPWKRCARGALFEMKRVIAGQDDMLERVLVCLLAGGHLLIEGVPGLAKTLTIKTTAQRARRHVPAASSSRPTSCRPTSSARASTARPPATFDTELGPVLLQLPARRRDQPRARQGAVRAARGHAGAAGHDRRHDARRAAAVPRHGDPEPDRVGGHLPAARGPGRPLHAQGARRLPAPEDELTVAQRALAGRVDVHARDRAAAARCAAGRAARRSTSTPPSRATPCGSRR